MINVVGLGYIGLPTALILAASGTKVVGTDYDEKLIGVLNAGKTTFDELGIEELYSEAIDSGIVFSNEYIETDMYIITVPTPYEKENKKINPNYILSAVKSVLKVCKKETILVIESTVSPGTIDKFVRPLIIEQGFEIGTDIHIVHAPERILPGNMIHELKHNSRTIGADNKEIGEKVKTIYSRFCESDIIVTDIRTAEMTKVVENTFRDINIAFANELTKICRSDNMNVHEIIKIANMHPRVNILNPGPGVGGHCISVDPWFLVGDYPGLTNIILTAREINDSMPEFVLERIHAIMQENSITDLKKVGLYGLTYKQDVDDVRESPTLQLLEKMEKHLAEPLKVYDPMVKSKIVKNQYMEFNEFLNGIDLVVVMVSHSHILNHLKDLKGKIVLDTQNIIKNAYKL
ncbi:UDP-N-acetyl-D-mannosaminuronic acid dehydrogenase [Carnobacterium maltaromaticum]|uniref:nucleotide sugar dehydrogenase n=1 Tax=Carnobacterium maltaromaticum TaxID=2751 RepID=UPI0010724417|nr:nucleotide sugar dehydrogenase [Carnobacterium maltaromaticum]TFJ24164.1 UDP-N-acetyl-D-mannosaminuronic acid dehydrogenase [Carnobacterium maltaromaticum]TFJ29569.1 UDP-N-acetyl-D-mannosaminuronic acid dehydrogenase [Carnobacterium maltaromaticum]TFJ32707.1 UDP-N-acetyl-D-mannosaminuronic acid dehydrogenase [Carnobacterium maltaromaticum]TFJ34823.1 UDP-N-acetyl-D-mannosaminuronic acid dehydrogenase [Carnobacterium maltaromaticum]TFJ42012.1 UDP-N-acetyl-D-mannosaminuronic acid dehydrogenase